MKLKKGFTLAEVTIALGIMAFLALISLYSFSKINPKVDKLKFKNANLSLKHALNSLLSNNTYYSDEGFLDLSEVVMDTVSTSSNTTMTEDNKFRILLFHEMGVPLGKGLDCYMLTDSTTPNKSYCYKGDNGVVWGVPNTDFAKSGVISDSNSSGGTSKYVPITIYTDLKDIDSAENFKSKAIVIGVRADGVTKLIYTEDCSNDANKKLAQCEVADLFASLNYKNN